MVGAHHISRFCHIHNIGATNGSERNLCAMVGTTCGNKIYYIHCMVMYHGHGVWWWVCSPRHHAFVRCLIYAIYITQLLPIIKKKICVQ